MRASDSTAKALIFSSFQATVDHLKEVLPSWGFGFRYINGEHMQAACWVLQVVCAGLQVAHLATAYDVADDLWQPLWQPGGCILIVCTLNRCS